MADIAPPTGPSDPKSLRALAHPVRWRLIDVLAAEGTATVTQCAEVTGESTATCSYHLGILAKYGFITRAAGAGRERPWQLVSRDLNLSAPGPDRDGAEASRTAAAALLDVELSWLKESVRRSAAEPADWQGATRIMSVTAWLTPEEAREAAAQVQLTIDRRASRAGARRRDGTRPVRLFAAVAPVAPVAPGARSGPGEDG
jgi:hypothetical protein